jgi:NAD(P)H-hydrate epimerase
MTGPDFPSPSDRPRSPYPAGPEMGPADGAAPAADGLGSLFVFTRRAVREVDRLAAQDYGVPTIVLMENAARHLADVCLDLLEEHHDPRVLVVCGPGHNGGDGLALARHLHNAGIILAIVLSAPDRGTAPAVGAQQDDAAANLQIVRKMGLPLFAAEAQAPVRAIRQAVEELGRPDLVVDALLGTGLDRPVREPLLGLIGAINELHKQGAAVVAADIPSGLDCDTGEPLGAAVHADVTVSFVGIKAGFTTLSAQAYLGDVVVADIGAPRELVERLGRPVDAGAPSRPAGPERRRIRGPAPAGSRRSRRHVDPAA